MPNYCSNCLLVEGDSKELVKFREYAKGPHRHHDEGEGEVKLLSEAKFIPYPEEYEKLDRIAHDWEKKADDLAKAKGFDNHWKYFNRFPQSRKKFIKENGEQPKDGFNQGGYEWCCNVWGSKWGNFDIYLSQGEKEENPEKLVYIFTTAWSPTTGLTKAMGEKFPKLKFTHDYEEPGVAFKGTFVMENGENTVDDTFELHSCPGCWNDIEECECTQEDILEEMKENGCEEKEIEDIKIDKYFLAKPKREE
ncbi:hypothetical protein KY326_03760 [Candidatus Woesearchaeota archaeon]|nr:hypothetical protein [Candidatus Woesearchaeota archaeon]